MIVDIHSHFFPRLSREEARDLSSSLPWLSVHDDATGTIMRGAELFRPVTAPLWDPIARVADLDRHGVDLQIISATPALFGYENDPAEAAASARHINDLSLAHCAVDTKRLKSLCQVPLQDLGLACDELDRAMASGHVGVQIGNHVGSRDMDDGALIEFLQHCGTIGAPVLVHPWDMMARERMDRYMLQWLVGMPAETQLSILYLILSGAFARLPTSLKLCFAHGGGSFAFLLGRVDNAWRNRDIVRCDCPELPSSYTNRFFTDSIVFEANALTLLVETMGSGRVMFGTDHPFPLGEQTPGQLIKDHAGLGPKERDQLFGTNALSFFNLHVSDTVAA